MFSESCHKILIGILVWWQQLLFLFSMLMASGFLILMEAPINEDRKVIQKYVGLQENGASEIYY